MRILFINHWAIRTGAPLVLLHFLKWLKLNDTNNRIDILTLKNGELLDEFSQVCDHHYFYHQKETLLSKSFKVVKRFLKPALEDGLKYPKNRLNSIAKNNYDLIFANTILSVNVSAYIKGKSLETPKLLVHIHELDLTINQYCPKLNTYLKDIDIGIAVSNKVKHNLLKNWGFTEDKIKVIYAHSKVPEFPKKTTGNFTVGASGLAYWRKGPEYFILVADYVIKKLPKANITFQWVGKVSQLNRSIYEQDIRKLKIENKVDFIGRKSNPHEWFSNFDIFLMTSKEDPFPLVCVELGMMGKPIICFKDATGTEEVINRVEGAVVPYLDISSMGDMIIKYFNDPVIKAEHGEQMKEIFKEFNPENQSGKIFEVMKSLIHDGVEK